PREAIVLAKVGEVSFNFGIKLILIIAAFVWYKVPVTWAALIAPLALLLLTPIVYPVPHSGTFATIVRLHPVTPLLVTTRELATTGVVSDPYRFLIVSGATVVGLFLTWVVFRLAMPLAIERVSS